MEGRVWGAGLSVLSDTLYKVSGSICSRAGRCLPSLGSHLRDEFPFIPCLPGGSESDGFIGINV